MFLCEDRKVREGLKDFLPCFAFFAAFARHFLFE